MIIDFSLNVCVCVDEGTKNVSTSDPRQCTNQCTDPDQTTRVYYGARLGMRDDCKTLKCTAIFFCGFGWIFFFLASKRVSL